MDLDEPISTANSSGHSLLAMVGNNTASLRRNSIELKELLVALQQQIKDLSEQVILLQAQVSDLNGQLAVERQSREHTSPSYASLQQAEHEVERERTRKSPKQPRFRYYRHDDSGPPRLGIGNGSLRKDMGVGIGGNGGGSGGGGVGIQKTRWN